MAAYRKFSCETNAQKRQNEIFQRNKWPKNEKIQGNNCSEIRFLLEKRQKSPIFVLEKRKCYVVSHGLLLVCLSLYSL